MRKTSLLLLSIVLAVFIIPLTLGLVENELRDVIGNESALTFNYSSTVQITTNPAIGKNITYTTTIIVTSEYDNYNITGFRFYLPDNSTTSVASDFILWNGTTGYNVSNDFVVGERNYANWTGLHYLFNGSANDTSFNITWTLDQPINAVSLSTSKSGRAYIETWNVTSTATNMTIENASLVVIPFYWYNRIGTPIAMTFNGTTKNYVANTTTMQVYTDLNLSDNLDTYGSGWSTLSVTYNGPTVDSSSGSSPSKVGERISEVVQKSGWLLLVIITAIIIVGIVITIVIVAKKR